MITRPKQLAARRDALVAQAALQRARAANASAEIRRALGWAERGVALARGAGYTEVATFSQRRRTMVALP